MSIDCDPQSSNPELFTLRGLRLRVVALVRARIALANTRGFASQSAEVIELGPSYSTSFYQIDVVNDGGVKRKNPFDADSETGFSYGDGFACAPMLASNHDAFKSLQSFFRLGFLDSHVDTHSIAWLKLGNIIA